MEIECPNCKHANTLRSEDIDHHDGSENEIECSNCEEKFYAVLSINYSLKSYCLKEKHDLFIPDGHKNIMLCKKCEYCKSTRN
jgi:hypothetical protein